jgi:hypothetical protein
MGIRVCTGQWKQMNSDPDTDDLFRDSRVVISEEEYERAGFWAGPIHLERPSP